jgi:hypothetical protein
MDPTTDSHLAARARAGDRDAFGELITRHLPMVTRSRVWSGMIGCP